MLTWSVLAIGYAVRRGSAFRWGMGGKGALAPEWLGRFFFLTAGAYGLLWSVATGGVDIGYLRSTSKLVSILKFVNSHVGLMVVDGFLGTVFVGFAIRAFKSLQSAEGGRARMISLTIGVAAAIIGIFSLVRLTLTLIHL